MRFNYFSAAPKFFDVLLEEQAMKVRLVGKAFKKLSAANPKILNLCYLLVKTALASALSGRAGFDS